mmetsp:Transcript_54730/g.169817  ORF Transcript_54730/g.169817 Transcript_54730/m.169817 type:complete len:293 (+) Transcript_54730:87-965(+)
MASWTWPTPTVSSRGPCTLTSTRTSLGPPAPSTASRRRLTSCARASRSSVTHCGPWRPQRVASCTQSCCRGRRRLSLRRSAALWARARCRSRRAAVPRRPSRPLPPTAPARRRCCSGSGSRAVGSWRRTVGCPCARPTTARPSATARTSCASWVARCWWKQRVEARASAAAGAQSWATSRSWRPGASFGGRSRSASGRPAPRSPCVAPAGPAVGAGAGAADRRPARAARGGGSGAWPSPPSCLAARMGQCQPRILKCGSWRPFSGRTWPSGRAPARSPASACSGRTARVPAP